MDIDGRKVTVLEGPALVSSIYSTGDVQGL